MAVSAFCPTCDRRYYLRDALGGAWRPCPKCGEMIDVPAAEEEEEEETHLSAAQMGIEESVDGDDLSPVPSLGNGFGASAAEDFTAIQAPHLQGTSFRGATARQGLRRAILWGFSVGFFLGMGLTLLLYRPQFPLAG